MPRPRPSNGTWLVIALLALAAVLAVLAAKFRHPSDRTPPVPVLRPDSP